MRHCGFVTMEMQLLLKLFLLSFSHLYNECGTGQGDKEKEGEKKTYEEGKEC